MMYIEVIVSCLSIIISIGSVIYARKSSKYTKENMQLTNAVTLELKLMEAKQAWDVTIKEVLEKLGTEREKIEALDTYHACIRENYLNIFERLCFFLLKNKTFAEANYKTQYQNMLNSTIKSLSTDKLPFSNIATTHYKKMIELNNTWQNS